MNDHTDRSRRPVMGRLCVLLSFILLALPHHAWSQVLLDPSLPSCAAGCAQLQNAQSSCTPAGGAPVSNQQTYQSCFCQSALLSQLYLPQPIAFCTQCSATDMATIQNWYKGYCNGGKGNTAASAGGASTSAASGATAASSAAGGQQATSTIVKVSNNPTATSTSSAVSPVNNTNPNAGKSWIQTHYKWVIMLILLVILLTAFTIAFYYLHRRYHARREAVWSASSAPPPDINTWGPGQSVHDFGAYAASIKRSLSRGRGSRKGKAASAGKKGLSAGAASREKSSGGSARSGGGGSKGRSSGSRSREKGKGAMVEMSEVTPVPPAPPVHALTRDDVGSGGYFGGRRAEEGRMF